MKTVTTVNLHILAAQGRLLSYYSRGIIISVPLKAEPAAEGRTEMVFSAHSLPEENKHNGEIAVYSLLPADTHRSVKQLEAWVKTQQHEWSLEHDGDNSTKLAFYVVKPAWLHQVIVEVE